MNTSIKKLFKNIAANQAGFLVSVVVTFFLSPFVVNSLGGTRYGIWSLIVSLTGNYGLLAFGIQGAMTRYIAHAAATNDQERVNGYFNTALSFLLCSGVLAVILGLLVSRFIDTIFVLPKDMVEEARSACVLVTFSAAATFAFAAFDSLLVAHQRFQITSAIGAITTLFRAVMTVWILKNGYGIVALAALGTGLTLFNGFIVASVVKRIYPWLKFSFSSVRRRYLNELLGYGYKSFTAGIAVALIYQCDLLVVGAYLMPDKVTTYSLASTIITYLIQFVGAIAFTFGPYATDLDSKGKVDELRAFFLQGSCLMYMLGGLIVSGCLIYGKNFYLLWLGPKYTDSALILSILVIPQFFATGARVGSAILVGMAKIGPFAIAAICEGISNLILSFILIRYLGIVGVALGTLIPILFNSGIWMPLYMSQLMGIKLRLIFLQSMLPGIGIGVIGVIIGYLSREFIPPKTWITFAGNIILSASICVSLSILVFSRISGYQISDIIFFRKAVIKKY